MKHRETGDGRMLLVPQPSMEDPNDPLNWSTTKKSLTFFNGCWFAFMGVITRTVLFRSNPTLIAHLLIVSIFESSAFRRGYSHQCCFEEIWTRAINDFITSSGALSAFMTVAAINVVVYLISIPFYLKRKEIRTWLHRKDFLRAASII
ncbi:hypothetical protein VN97_g3724 [Penicillium thymicola]|uniref:Uncharacterized protein n=1 Tax=Penicillium thymicola TaxID=293382 RepID=A0AAI9TLM1_PENTH|nr:hypothetical protein VN97_g3724 [Penicillium thymicola]